MDQQPLWQSRGLLLALVALSALAGATALFGQHSAEQRDAGAVNAAAAPITDPAMADPLSPALADLAELPSLVNADALLAPLRAGASTTPIIVSLAPSPNADSLGWRAGDDPTATPAGWDADLGDPLIRDQRRHEVASELDWLLEQLTTPGLEITEVFRYQFGVAGNATAEALEQLAQHPAVRQIEPDRRLDGAAPNAASPSATATTVSALIADLEQAIAQLNADSDASARVLGIETAARPFATPGHCDAQLPALATAAAHARAAGISLFAPAGDDGYCDRLAWPACLSAVHAVGAVHAADQGFVESCVAQASCVPAAFDAQRCPEGGLVSEQARADHVPANSNTSTELTLLAPAEATPSAGSEAQQKGPSNPGPAGQTLLASRLAAEIAQLVQHAAKTQLGIWPTPSELADHLRATGYAITDAKSGLTKPRIDLAAALAGIEQMGQRETEGLDALSERARSQATLTQRSPTREHHRGAINGLGYEANERSGSAQSDCLHGDHFQLMGQTINGPATHYFQACETLTAGPNLTIAQGADVTLEACHYPQPSAMLR